MDSDNLLEIRNLNVEYSSERGQLRALRNVELSIPRGSIVGVVGESGCGKSTMINSIIGLLAQNASIASGSIEFEGSDLLKKNDRELRNIRGTQISMIFQDPMTALNPVLSIGTQMIDIQYRDKISKAAKKQRSINMLQQVGIPDPETRLKNFPHQFSGGMRQRIAIAMALQAEPALLIADEPTTALDATLEVQIIRRLKELQQSMGCSILFISHHLGVIAELCDYVIVMYGGEVVERGSVRDIFHRASHPYTRKLLECDPALIPEITRSLPTIPGEIPDLSNLPSGCIFNDRCDSRIDKCSLSTPPDYQIETAHWARCHLSAGQAVE
ncbi:MAG: oligopeptide/dipeptide ABC transporter ATP-binding protein [Gammaproteobacteria bacterium]|jgi:oligopeptide/dipeptide ABC transporter ATP-binding protein